MAKTSLLDRCARIRFLLMDVDGVLTDGSIVYTERGDEIKAFHVRDGSGLKLWRQAGKQAGILTGRRSDLVLRRGIELGMTVIMQGVEDKGAAFEQLASKHALGAEEICYIGDDVPDVPALRRCGLAAVPADACGDCLSAAHYVTQQSGGHGAVREVIELILQAQDAWDRLVRETVAQAQG